MQPRIRPFLYSPKFHIFSKPKQNESLILIQHKSASRFHNHESIPSTDELSLQIQNLLKINEIEQALTRFRPTLSEDLVLNVLRRHRSDWKSAYIFFNWVSNASGYEAAQKIEEATEFFHKRKEFGLDLDLVAFQTLLLSLCRYKHVEAVEFLFHSKKKEFQHNIKTMNIILNGWCVLGSLREAKRFWNDIITSKYKPDRFTYGIFINSLTKAGKISTAVKLFQAMWAKGCTPDVAICNCIIDGLCFKKRIPEALEIFKEMNEKDCFPDAATYNCLIKHLCKIRRMEKVNELLDEMTRKGGDCSPNARTYGYLLNSAKTSDEVMEILNRMETNDCKMMGDTYNLMLRLFIGWGDEKRVEWSWAEMERNGLGPDQRSYTVMVHGLYEKGRLEEAMLFSIC
ncbi:hypothetical protein L1987_84591 [Smallanthus sonchifolius]|uniref:Uncharacterized protein n=1 Tax=Smallanthus sonchifolius TaxID=185202 RepID=A0ACB8XVB6_9ASTR|nr:hypothetical protein L1987_84591 [Smallanthus sonchifolius]